MNDGLTRFRTRLNTDTAIQARLRAGEDPIVVARELGFDVSRDDLTAAVRDADLELTDFELELVSGGMKGKLDESEADDSWNKIKGMFSDPP